MEIIRQIIIWMPAIILPLASFLQLYSFMKEKNADSINGLAWALFCAANIGAYMFTEKYFSIIAILAFLVTAVIDMMIVGYKWYLNRKKSA